MEDFIICIMNSIRLDKMYQIQITKRFKLDATETTTK